MSLAYQIARRIYFAKERNTQRVSPPAIRIAVAGIAIGLAVMLLSVAIVVGFKHEVRQKVIGFGGHLTLQAMESSNATYERSPICVNDSILDLVSSIGDVRSVVPYVTKPAVLKTDSDFLSVVIKGVPEGADTRFFEQSLVEGTLPQTEREVIVSRTVAGKLRLAAGDKARFYFVKADALEAGFGLGAQSTSVKTRTLTVSGIYETHFEQYDRMMIVGSMPLLQQVNGWDDDMVSGMDINLADFDALDDHFYALIEVLDFCHDRRGTPFFVQTIEQQNPQLFSWLDLLDTNVWVILALMSAVAAFTMISGLLIIIMERTHMIGLLKALGMTNGQLRKVFLYMALFLTGKGLLWGNLIGLGLCFVQHRWHLIALDPANYYLEWVPIELNVWMVLMLNVVTVVVTLLVLIAPSAMVARIAPTRAIQSE